MTLLRVKKESAPIQCRRRKGKEFTFANSLEANYCEAMRTEQGKRYRSFRLPPVKLSVSIMYVSRYYLSSAFLPCVFIYLFFSFPFYVWWTCTDYFFRYVFLPSMDFLCFRVCLSTLFIYFSVYLLWFIFFWVFYTPFLYLFFFVLSYTGFRK